MARHGAGSAAGTGPGRGGISRGRGDAALDFSGETPGRTDEFEARELSPAERLDADSTAIVGVGATAPSVEPRAEGAGLVETEASAGRAAWKRRVAPRHRVAVESFFDKGQKSMDPK